MNIRYTVRGADSAASHRKLTLFGWKGQMTRGGLFQCVVRGERDGAIKRTGAEG
jgi:hypothetical protein